MKVIIDKVVIETDYIVFVEYDRPGVFIEMATGRTLEYFGPMADRVKEMLQKAMGLAQNTKE